MPEDFLESFLAGEPWTLGSRRRGGVDSMHEQIVKQIAACPDILEPGLRLQARDVFVSVEFERGYIDLLFRDRDDRFLIVGVKVKASELDKAAGQLFRHRRLFAEMNSIVPARIRIALACQAADQNPGFAAKRRSGSASAVRPAAQRPNHPAPGRRLAGFNPTERTTEGGGLISNRSPSFIRAS